MDYGLGLGWGLGLVVRYSLLVWKSDALLGVTPT